MKALIIDDESDICFLLSSILRQQNVESSCANNLSEANNSLSQFTPTLIFLDNHLPDGLGINYVQHIKSLYPFTKVVMISAYDTAADRLLAEAKGVDLFIGKPFTRETVINAIASIRVSH